MAIQKLLLGRTRRRVVMDAGAFDVRPIALGGRVVQGEQQAVADGKQAKRQPQQQAADELRLASQAAKKVIIGLVVVSQSAAAQPTGDGLASLSEEYAGAKRQQSPGQPGMQRLAELADPNEHLGGQLPLRHPWLSCLRQGCVRTPIVTGEPFSAYAALLLTPCRVNFFQKVQNIHTPA